MKNMTLDEIKEIRITPERAEEIRSFHNTDFSDRPKQTEEELSRYRKARETHPEWFTVKPKKEAISLRIDKDVLETYRSLGKGYQKAMNEVLRLYVEEHPSDFYKA